MTIPEVVSINDLARLIDLGGGYFFGTLGDYSGLFVIDTRTYKVVEILVGQESRMSAGQLLDLVRGRLNGEQLKIILVAAGAGNRRGS